MLDSLTVFAAAAALAGAVRQEPSDVRFDLVAVADSGTYYVYEYELTNPESSRSGLISVVMDVSARSGTPPSLTSTGDVRDWLTRNPNRPPHAEVGMSGPVGWKGTLTASAKIQWHLPYSTTASSDSVSPGQTVSGFVVRSSYLPGMREMAYAPTVESCCLVPIDNPGGPRSLPQPSRRTAPGWAVGPRFAPDEVDVEVLDSQLDAACEETDWIPVDVCRGLSEGPTPSERDDAARVREILSALERSRERIRGGAVYLLEMNARQVLRTIAPG